MPDTISPNTEKAQTWILFPHSETVPNQTAVTFVMLNEMTIMQFHAFMTAAVQELESQSWQLQSGGGYETILHLAGSQPHEFEPSMPNNWWEQHIRQRTTAAPIGPIARVYNTIHFIHCAAHTDGQPMISVVYDTDTTETFNLCLTAPAHAVDTWVRCGKQNQALINLDN